jgi:hypothetical protein
LALGEIATAGVLSLVRRPVERIDLTVL